MYLGEFTMVRGRNFYSYELFVPGACACAHGHTCLKAAAHCRTFMRLAGLKPLRPEVWRHFSSHHPSLKGSQAGPRPSLKDSTCRIFETESQASANHSSAFCSISSIIDMRYRSAQPASWSAEDCSWTQELDEQVIELWSENRSLYAVSDTSCKRWWSWRTSKDLLGCSGKFGKTFI